MYPLIGTYRRLLCGEAITVSDLATHSAAHIESLMADKALTPKRAPLEPTIAELFSDESVKKVSNHIPCSLIRFSRMII
jgi:hypothetical protein